MQGHQESSRVRSQHLKGKHSCVHTTASSPDRSKKVTSHAWCHTDVSMSVALHRVAYIFLFIACHLMGGGMQMYLEADGRRQSIAKWLSCLSSFIAKLAL